MEEKFVHGRERGEKKEKEGGKEGEEGREGGRTAFVNLLKTKVNIT